MPTTPAVIQFGSAGWLVLLAFMAATVTRLLKADKLNTWLLSVNLPALPKAATPWVAMVLSFIGGALEALVSGHAIGDSALMGVWGLFSGSLAIAGHESLEKPGRAVLGNKVGDILFGRATPDDATTYGNAPPTPPTPPSPSVTARTALMALGVTLGVLGGCAGASVLSIIQVVALAAPAVLQVVNDIASFVTAYFVAHPDPAKEAEVRAVLAKLQTSAAGIGALANGGTDISEGAYTSAMSDFAQTYSDILLLIKGLPGVTIQAPGTVPPTAVRGQMILVVPPVSAFTAKPKISK